MIKAVVLDFYGTIVEESYGLLDKIADIFIGHGAGAERAEVSAMWWPYFREKCERAHGKDFRLQKEIYPEVFRDMAAKTGACGLDFSELAQMVVRFAARAPMFADAAGFLSECPLPYYILSNIDNAELAKVLSAHGLKPCGVFTSEDAREYKPRKGIFEKGLKKFGLSAGEVVYAGDSYVNDYLGAQGAGILSFWLNRKNEPVPAGVRAIPDLYALLPELAKL
ncbi:MAG TPA: HAD family hydrolase [Candidatus Borkfalkia stercoripullorum]|nr:HAD family hydrolase [Candidatus Borkfalkia stercoripullorum]